MTSEMSINVRAILAGLDTKFAGEAICGGQKATPEKMFSQLLNQALGACKKKFLYKEAIGEAQKDINGGFKGTGGNEMNQRWVESFRKMLMSSGIPLEDLWLSNNAASDLKQLLLHEGFSENTIQQLFQKLFNGQENRINVKNLLSQLSKLEEVSDMQPPELTVETSAIPHVETLLRKFGFDPQETKKILNESREEGRGLDLEGLLSRLKVHLEKGHGKGSEGFRQLPFENSGHLSTQVGIKVCPDKGEGPVTLEQFVQMLSEKVNALQTHRLSDSQMDEAVKGLLDQVVVKDNGKSRNGENWARGRDAQELGAFFQKAFGEAKTGKPAGSSMSDPKDPAAWKSLQEVLGRMDSTSGQQGASEIAQTGKQGSVSKFEQFIAFREKVTSELRSEDKGVDPVHLKPEIPARPTNGAQISRPAAESLPGHVVRQVGRRIGLALKNGQNEVKIRLKPPELGSIQLEMSMKDNILKVAMVAENQSVKEVLLAHVSDLKQNLLQQGIELQKMDVEINYDFGQSMANARKNLNRGESGPGSSSLAGDSVDPDDESGQLDAVRTGTLSGYGMLDVFV